MIPNSKTEKKDNGAYRKLHTGERVPAEQWRERCFEETGLRVEDESAPLADEAVDALCEWVASGEWLYEEGSE